MRPHIRLLEQELGLRFVKSLREENLQRLINTLPTEIFFDVVDMLRTPELVRATHVCALWRDSILGCTSLWADVNLQGAAWPETTIIDILARSDKQRNSSDHLPLNGVTHLSLPTLSHRLDTRLFQHPAPRLRSLQLKLHQTRELVWMNNMVFQGNAPHLQSISLRSVYLRPPLINLPSVRFFEVSLHPTSKSSNSQQLKHIALMCPNLQYLHVCDSDHPLSESRPVVVEEPFFQVLKISVDTFPFDPSLRQHLRINLQLIPKIIIQSGDSDVKLFLLDIFPVVIRVYINEFGAQGRTEDGRVFWWTFRFARVESSVDNRLKTISFGGSEVESYLRQAFPSIHSLYLQFGMARGLADDGRKFTWSGASPSADSSLISGSWLSSIKRLHVDVDRLLGLNSASAMRSLESLTIEILPRASQRVLHNIFGMDPEHEPAQWPTRNLHSLTIRFGGQPSGNGGAEFRTISIQ